MDDVLEIDRLAVAKAIYDEGAYCGDCEYEGWDTCSACREVNRSYADAVIKLGWRPRTPDPGREQLEQAFADGRRAYADDPNPYSCEAGVSS